MTIHPNWYDAELWERLWHEAALAEAAQERDKARQRAKRARA